jgi:hypothetical protein
MPTPILRSSPNLKVLLVGCALIVSAFAVGVQTAGDIQPIALIEAGSNELPGDLDGSGIVDLQDAILILEIAQGYRELQPEHLRRDPSGDGVLTVDDALRILHSLTLR